MNKKAIIVCGSPAVGKTTYAKALAKSTSSLLLDIDTCTERMVQTSLYALGRSPDDRDSEFFKDTFREPIYETLFDIALENLAFNNVIIVGPFTKEIRRPDYLKFLQTRLKHDVEVHYLFCPRELIFERMKSRGAKRDKSKLKDWEAYSKYYGKETPPCFEHLAIDTSKQIPQ